MKSIILILFFSFSVFAGQESAVVVSEKAAVYKDSNRNKASLFLKQGKKINVLTPAKNGFYQIKAKRGKKLYIAEADVSLDESLENDIETSKETTNRSTQQSQYPKFTYDFSVSTGSNKVLKENSLTELISETYTEVNLGLNYHHNQYFVWRNALFYRTQTSIDDLYGLDTSARAGVQFGSGALGLSAFAGGGYRFVSEGDNAPFYEIGFTGRLVGMTLGISYKEVLNSIITDGAENDRIVGLVLAGRGAF